MGSILTQGEFFESHSIQRNNKTETSKVGAISKAPKAQRFRNMPGTKQFRDAQRVPFILDMTRKPLFPQLQTKKTFF